MPYDVRQLLQMSQAQLDELFTSSAAGEILNGEAEGTAIVAPGTTYSLEIASLINHFARGRARPSTPRRDCSRLASWPSA